MSQSVLENDLGESDRALPQSSLQEEGGENGPLYQIPLLLIMGLVLKDSEKDEGLCSGVALDGKYKEEIMSLILESRPVFVEPTESTKTFGGRFGAIGFSSRGGRNGQRGRSFTGHVGGTGRRSIIRQPDENLWDMPCSEMSSLTLGDIREAESKMKAEDLTLDQFVERQRESNDRKSQQFSQSTQKKNFVSIPISGEAPIKVNNTFSLNGGSLKSAQDDLLGGSVAGIQRSSNQLHNPHIHTPSYQNQDLPIGRLHKSGPLHSHQGVDLHQLNGPSSLRSSLIEDERTVPPMFPSVLGNRKSSSISEAFLSGPANLSLFDVKTPIFDDDNTETMKEFRIPIVNAGNVTASRYNFEGDFKSKFIPEHPMRVQTHFDQVIQSPVSNFSWSSRTGNHDVMDNSGISNLSKNTSFPALSKSSQFSQSQVKTQSDHPIISPEQSILHKLQAAGIAPKIMDKGIIGNTDRGGFSGTGFFDPKFRQHPASNEYPPLSSASNAPIPPLPSAGAHNLKFNNQIKSNDAGRFLMSILGAGQQNNNSNRNYASNFNIRNPNQRLNPHDIHNVHSVHNAHSNNGHHHHHHNHSHHHNASHNASHIGNFSRF
ncbi:hypothetical protein OJ252_2477 [Cryptosporidium canis]|uniref:Uncharacterized protein n=1 Tax=Cryptosporidium canis TaxID=195482 RepID=A0ABQ8P826_9CRYT|nr:hypothetical protein OJ252_2477 [Cryptosporidium canis]